MTTRRSRRLATLLAWAALAWAAPAAAAGLPAPVTRTLANGLTVAVFEDDRLPIVQVQLLVAAGSAHEPAGEAGVANLAFQMLGRGTASRTAAAFDDAVQALGGSVGGSVSREFATVNGAFLAADLEAGLELLADGILNPLLSEEALPGIKDQAVGGLVNARRDPGALADEHLWAAVFREHPYGRPPLGAPGSLTAIGIAEVRAFHRQRYRPDRALLAIAGDVTPERAFKAAEEVFSSWGGRVSEAPAGGTPPPEAGWRVRIVDAPGLVRCELRLGAVGPARGDPDHDAFALAGELLAGGTEPRLRVAASGLRGAGLFSIASSAPTDSAGAEVERLRAALAAALAGPPAPAALEAAKRRLLGGIALQVETRGGLIAQWMAATLYAGAGDRMGEQPDRVAALTAEAVRAALARRVSPDRMVLVAVGPADRLRPQLERLGPVEVVPAAAVFEVLELPSAARTPPTPEGLERGRALVAQAAAAHGGLERLRSLKDSTLEGDIVMTPGPREQRGRMVQVRKDPDRFQLSVMISVLKSIQVLDGDRGWSQAGDAATAVDDLDSLGVVALRTGFRTEPRYLLLSASDPASRVAWRGRERRDERETDVIEVVAADGERRVLFLDAATHRLVAVEQHDGGHTVRRLYRDLRSVSGVLWPFAEERLVDGQRTMTFILDRVAFNTGVKDALFRRPGSAPEAGQDPPARRPRAR
jgi:predicted Zn-dependent peptidase